jgi:nicotinamidase-related amidase
LAWSIAAELALTLVLSPVYLSLMNESQRAMTTTAALAASYDRLTRDNAVLLLIDHQVGPLWELEFTATRRRVVELATVARQLAVPTIVSAIAPDGWGPVIPELGPAIGGDRVIVRRRVNAWDEARVRRAVESTGRKKLVLAGSVVEVAVVMCALGAAGAGYEVYAPIDASGQSSHRALVRLARAGVIVTTTSLVNGELLSDDGVHHDASGADRLPADEFLRRRLRTSRRAAADARGRRYSLRSTERRDDVGTS